MRTHARVEKGDIHFSSALARAHFFSKNNGKAIIIEPDDSITAEMRRYFEGCIVPVVYYTHPASGWTSFRDARDAVKLEFLPSKPVKSLKGKITARSVPSTADLSKEQFRQFIDAITRWLLENQLCGEDDLDSKNYIAWRDSAPGAAEIYPPLRRLKERHEVEMVKHFPWRKKI